eukprot:2482557-Prymnesium_polylepis.1
MITTERTRRAAHVWMHWPLLDPGRWSSAISYRYSQRAGARWPFSGLGCQLARALAVADGQSQ